jgi:hypothetical protein
MRNRLPVVLVVLLLCGIAAQAASDEIPYTAAKAPWADKLGNHRARIRIEEKSDRVWVRIPWRRRDHQPERKDIIVIDAATNKRIDNVLAVNINREYGDLLIQPTTAPGDYFVYYMPYQSTGAWWSPSTVYPSPVDRADATWAGECKPTVEALALGKTDLLPRAKVLGIEAISEFHRFDPMEVIATADERSRLLTQHRDKPYLLFPEDRRHPIRMTDDLPARWIRTGPGTSFKGEACRGEFYAFQVGLFTSADSLENVGIEFGDLTDDKGNKIPASALRCFNLGGTDWLGKPFRKELRVPRGKVQALWFGVQVAPDAVAGTYRGALTFRARGVAATRFDLTLAVTAQVLADAGDGDLWRHARLRWLDSTIGLDEEVLAPFTPVTVKENTIGVLGRRVQFNDRGLLSSIQSTFSRGVDRVDAPAREILAGPMQLVVDDSVWKGKVAITSQKSGAVAWESSSQADGLALNCRAKMECDGYVNYRLTLRTKEARDLKNIRLEIPLRRDAAVYMMGMGRKGGYRPKEWQWKWDVQRSNSQVWIGDVNAGLSLKLKHLEDRWDLYNLRQSGTYRDWSNDGKGGCTIREDGDQVVISAFTGSRRIAAGEEVQLNFGLLITPLKKLDNQHWSWRYFHTGSGYRSVAEVAATGANIINIHQGNGLNPHINYPFDTANKFAAYTKEAHARGLKVKTYYTVREQSNYTAELWALRSLGNEVFLDGDGFKLADHFLDHKPRPSGPSGGSWLCEHLVTGYTPAWHTPVGPAHIDASLATTGLSRWHNYYLEGLNWLIRNAGCDGIYLDGVGYDREIMKRVRKVMQRARPGCLIDFHSGNNFHPDYGLNSPANQYLELFPYLDSLWLGEGYNYGESPDYWLVEISGIPFGLFGEMLHGGGNPWRGMVYGMTNRLAWSGDPRPLWKLWDEFGIQDAAMFGYWHPDCPVKTDQKDVLVTCYVKKGKTLVALASWNAEPVQTRLSIDWKALGLRSDKAHLYAPAVKGLQSAAQMNPTDEIPVFAGKGHLFVIDEEAHDAPPLRIANAYENRKLLWEDRFDGAELGAEWTKTLSKQPKTAIKPGKEGLTIEAPANCFAFVERPLPPECTLVECKIFSGTDDGATWGTGLALLWKGRSLRINLRATEGRFGVDDGTGQSFGGSASPKEWFHVRIRLEPDQIVAEASRDGKLWHAIRTLPRNQFRDVPLAVRVGKMRPGMAGNQDSSPAGPHGTSAIKELRVYGAKR